MSTKHTHKYLTITYAICIIIVISTFIADVLYTAKYVIKIENVGLERWAILITLLGIFASLKLLHPKLKEIDREDVPKAIKKYTIQYFTRLVSLFSIYIFNLISFTNTGSKNFVFLAFITIFAMFLCAPNKKHLKEEIYIEENEL